MLLVCQVILQDDAIKGSCDLMSGSLSWQVITLASLVAISIVIVKI